jgi:hypothetical protein
LSVDYKEWNRADALTSQESAQRYVNELTKGRSAGIFSLFPEFNIEPNDLYTFWQPPGSPSAKERHPQSNLANLVTQYNRIFVPIERAPSRQLLERRYAMSLDVLTSLLRDNPDTYIPILAKKPFTFEAAGFYDKLFRTCHDMYGYYPPFPGNRTNLAQTQLALFVKTGNLISQTDLPTALREFPEYDFENICRREILNLTGAAGLHILRTEYGLDTKSVVEVLATAIQGLRVWGHEDLVRFLLNDFYSQYHNPLMLSELLLDYDRYLVHPINSFLGGFANYDTRDLERMAFLRVLPLMKKQIRALEKENFKLIFNSPGARSAITVENCKAKMFLKGGHDVNTLHTLSEFADRHKGQTEQLSEFRQFILSRDLVSAANSFAKSKAIYTAISAEVNDLAKKEHRMKRATYSLAGGALLLGDLALYSQGLPPEWKLVVAMFKDAVSFFGLKNLNPKKIVELLCDLRDNPWYERGVPFLYWRRLQ